MSLTGFSPALLLQNTGGGVSAEHEAPLRTDLSSACQLYQCHVFSLSPCLCSQRQHMVSQLMRRSMRITGATHLVTLVGALETSPEIISGGGA